MKSLAEIFGINTEVATTVELLNDMDKPAREGGQGLPNAEFYIMPLVGKTKFTIGEKEHTPSTVCVLYKDRAGAWSYRMVSVASFGRSARDQKGETADAKTIQLIDHEIKEQMFTLKPTEVIATFKGKVCKIVETKVLFFPDFTSGQPNWDEAKSRETTLRKMETDEKGYAEARKAFDALVKEQKLEAVVKAVEKTA